MSIEVQNLTKIYGSQKALDKVSFSIGSSEIVGFLGPNGAGKSTTMKILSGYVNETSGSAHILGMDVSQDGLKIKKRIGYLPSIEYSEKTTNTSWKMAVVAPKLNPTFLKRTRIYKNIPMIAKAIAQVDRTVISLAIVGPTLLLDNISPPFTL